MARPRTASLRLAALATLVAAVALPTSGWTWGSQTHRYIAQNYSKHLPPTMDGLRNYDNVVYQHVNDPDTRRPSTPGEAPRHFIDIDYYPEFHAGTLSHDRAVLEAQYGAATVEAMGILPWAVGEVVTTLTQQFQALQWDDAALTIADLCHYVGDSTQPLHCTQNYDGQMTGNNGIHSRYETTMINAHIGELSTAATIAGYYPNVVDEMFAIIGESWDGVSPVLNADNTAKAASSGNYNTTYYNSLWNSTQTLTRSRVDEATIATASFVRTAWINAGSPAIPGSSSVPPTTAGPLLTASPTPFRDVLGIRFAGTGPLTIDVYDVRGARIERIVARASSSGNVTWRPTERVSPGLYFVRLTGPGGLDLVRRITRLD